MVFLVSAMRMLPSGATTARNACGSVISASVLTKPSPSERAASACPTGTVLSPERSASHTNAEV